MVTRLPVEALDPAAGTDGQVPILSGGRFIIGTPGGGGSSLAWFNVKDYGAVGDGVADDTSAINAAIAALNAAGGGVLYFPTGIYKTTAALTTIAVCATVIGDGCADSHFRNANTTIRLNSTTAVMFTVGSAAHGTKFAALNLVNNAASAPTAGAAIQVLGGDGARYDELTISGFWINMDMQDGQEWTMQRCFIYSPVKYGMKIRHIDLPDGGDMGITNCQFLAGDYNADAAIRYETGGGLRLTNFKINARTLSHKFVVGLDCSITANTADLYVSNGSIENITGVGIKGRNGGGSFLCVGLDNIQFGYWASTTASAIDIDGWRDVSIDNIIGEASTSSSPVVKLANVTNGAIGSITNDGFSADYSLTSCTNIKTPGAPSSRSITAGTGLTGGGDLSADRTLAIDTAAEAERVRDVVGTALVELTGIDITVDDAGDTISIAVTSSPSTGEVLMQDGVTGPPVPIETEARDDWLYAG